ncbi:glycosyltransferase family 4 protein [Billgrantia gudaonensis]|uniref:glycosyltransferase family 4 protein n=1 Tax=Billgrantia gudaonensis TaxID=376427 RepID=UPI001FDF52B4|nr:glycosyltransferase family 4 protein [Halomonas gudaonensis]
MNDTRPLAAVAIRQVAKMTGATRIALHQAQLLSEMGFRVAIICEKGDTELVSNHGIRLAKVTRWPFKGAFRRRWYQMRVSAWCRKNRPDLIISHGDVDTNDILFMHNCVHLAEQRIFGNRKSPSDVATIHDEILTRQSFQKVVANSQLMANDFKSRYAIPDEKIKIHYPGYDPKKFNLESASRHRDSTRSDLGVNRNECLIGLVTSGNFKKRNVEFFIKLASTLNEIEPDKFRFLVVGKGKKTEYLQQAESAGVSDKFVWMQTVPDVEKIYGALDLFVLPAKIEEFGCVALEAMACGIPVLLSPWVGASELLREKFPSLIVEDENEYLWAERLLSVIKRDSAKLGLALSALSEEYSHEKQREKLAAEFSQFNK